MSPAKIRTKCSTCQSRLMFTCGTNLILVSEFIYAEFAYSIGTFGVSRCVSFFLGIISAVGEEMRQARCSYLSDRFPVCYFSLCGQSGLCID